MPEKLTQGPLVLPDVSRFGSGLTRGSRRRQVNAAAWSGTWPAPGATLDLDFANNRGFVRGVGQGGAMDAVTFTRASNGTFVGSDGRLAGSGGNQGALGNNLLTFPQDFNNASWTVSGAALTPSAGVSPQGLNNASFLSETTSDVRHIIKPTSPITVNAGLTYTASCYAKAAQRGVVTISIHTNSGTDYAAANFDLFSGVVTQSAASGSGFSVASASGSINSDGWCRCTLTFTSTAAPQFGIGVSNATTGIGAYGFVGYTGVINSGIFIWGAQLELGSTATTYYPTNINTPRFDWASTAQLPQNLFLHTENFNASYWSLFNVTVSGTTTAPDGTSLLLFTENTTNNLHAFRPTALTGLVTTNDTYTVSFVVKSNGRRYINISYGVTASNAIRVGFDLQTGTISGSIQSSIAGASGTANIEDLSGGFYRISFSVTGLPTTTLYGPVVYLSTTGLTNLANQDTQNTYVGDGVSGIYIGAAQFNIGNTPNLYKAVGAFNPSNTPIIPAPTCNGLLIEESRTNRILWCRDATQSNWTKTNVATTKDQTGIDGVANAASSLAALADNATCIQTITLTSSSRTTSIYLKRITGTGSVQVSLDGSTWSTVDLSTTEWRRIVLSGTVTNPVVGIRLVTNGDAVAMDYAQVEDGAFATTPILTTSATATRAVDAATVDAWKYLPNVQTTLGGGVRGTLYFEGSNQTYIPSNTTIPVAIGGYSSGVSIWCFATGYSAYYNSAVGGITPIPALQTVVSKAAFSWCGFGTQRFAVNGTKAAMKNYAANISYGNMNIFQSGSGATAASYAKRISFFPFTVYEDGLAQMTR